MTQVEKHAIILGRGSDIGKAIGSQLHRDGWGVSYYRHDEVVELEAWNLIVCCYGSLEPIGNFWEVCDKEWEDSFEPNLFQPVRQVRELYPYRRQGASVCFFSGAGTGGPAPTYSAYAVSKAALIKMVECMDNESNDCKFFILGPGVVRTKIHEQTLEAGRRAANIDRVLTFLESGEPGTSMDDIYACLMSCVDAPKEAVGGRNIYVPFDDWSRLGELSTDPNAFKLRRCRDIALRSEADEIQRLLLAVGDK